MALIILNKATTIQISITTTYNSQLLLQDGTASWGASSLGAKRGLETSCRYDLALSGAFQKGINENKTTVCSQIFTVLLCYVALSQQGRVRSGRCEKMLQYLAWGQTLHLDPRCCDLITFPRSNAPVPVSNWQTCSKQKMLLVYTWSFRLYYSATIHHTSAFTLTTCCFLAGDCNTCFVLF